MSEESGHTSMRRIQLACAPCHRSKLKCDRQSVCDQCLRRSRPSECIYTERGLRCNTARQQASSMRAKVDYLEKMFFHLKGNRIGEEQPVDSRGPFQRYDNDVLLASPSVKVTSLSQPAGNTYYISPSHWEAVMDCITDVKAHFDREDECQPLDCAQDSEHRLVSIGPDSHFNISCLSTKGDLLSLMPPKSDMDRFVGAWYDSIDPLRLIVHAPSFHIDYQRFWHSPESLDTQWLAMLFAIATAGAEISSQVRDDAATKAMADQLRSSTAHAINLADCTTNKKWLLETLLIHARAHQLRKQDTDNHVCMLAGFCARLAIMAGLHVDPSFNTALSPYVGEMRRRIWASVCEYDVVTSYQRGAFSAIFRTKSNTRQPANLLDADFSREVVPQPRTTDDYTPSLYQAYYAHLIDIFGDVVHSSETLERCTRVETDALYYRLVQARDSWPKILRLIPFDQAFGDSNELMLNRYNLEFLYLKAVCILFRNYIRRPGAEQDHCLAAAENLVRNQLTMLENAQPGYKLESSMVFLKHHVHDFNLATMLLCLDMATPQAVITKHDLLDRLVRLRPVIVQTAKLWLQAGVPSRKARQGINAVLKYLHREQCEVRSSRAEQLTECPESLNSSG